jgi:hypothetical protein
MTEWHPIDTVPRMRNVILFAVTERLGDGSVANWRMDTGYATFDPIEWTWGGRRLEVWDHKPTRWRPMPDPPEDCLIAAPAHGRGDG